MFMALGHVVSMVSVSQPMKPAASVRAQTEILHDHGLPRSWR